MVLQVFYYNNELSNFIVVQNLLIDNFIKEINKWTNLLNIPLIEYHSIKNRQGLNTLISKRKIELFKKGVIVLIVTEGVFKIIRNEKEYKDLNNFITNKDNKNKINIFIDEAHKSLNKVLNKIKIEIIYKIYKLKLC
jgi:hypothetical protein